MRLPYAKPENYSTLPLKEKAKFIMQCCDDRQSLWQKMHVNFFGRKHSTYIETIKAIAKYMAGYLNEDLDECLKKGIKQYKDYCGSYSETYIPDLKTCKENTLNERDIEVAYAIINQCFLTNNEFYWFAIRKENWDPYQNTQISDAFRTYLSGILVHERRKWEALFPGGETCNDLLSEKIRPAVKAILVVSSGIAFAAGGIGLAPLAFALVATGLYGISGELSDNIANIFSKQPVQDTTSTNDANHNEESDTKNISSTLLYPNGIFYVGTKPIPNNTEGHFQVGEKTDPEKKFNLGNK